MIGPIRALVDIRKEEENMHNYLYIYIGDRYSGTDHGDGYQMIS